MKKRCFSLMELLVVVLVILTLLSLSIPSLQRIYFDANTISCSKNLKDLHALVTCYANDNTSVLPGYMESDNPLVKYNDKRNCNAYKYWNGHLINYIDPDFSIDQWGISTKFHKSGKWYTDGGNLADHGTNGYDLLNDGVKGKGAFQAFLCPEAIDNSIDPGIFIESENESVVPKIFNLSSVNSMGKGAFYGGNFSSDKGIPLAYTANDNLFQSGRSRSERKKISTVNNFGKKILLMEGGNNLGYFVQSPYIHASGNDLDDSQLGYRMVNHSQFKHKEMHFSFLHDFEEEFWYSIGGTKSFNKDILNNFNDLYTPNIYCAPNQIGSAYTSHINIGTLVLEDLTLITTLDPDLYQQGLDNYENHFGKSWDSSFKYIGQDDIRSRPLTGKSNVLFGDGTVKLKHASWIFTNRMELFSSY